MSVKLRSTSAGVGAGVVCGPEGTDSDVVAEDGGVSDGAAGDGKRDGPAGCGGGTACATGSCVGIVCGA